MSNYVEKGKETTEIIAKPKFGKLHFPFANIRECCGGFSSIQKKINKLLIHLFENLGAVISRQWSYFVIIPLLLGCIALTGLQKVHFDDDSETLSLPIKGKWSIERNSVEQLFGMKNRQLFDPSRLSTLGQYVNLIVKSKEPGGNILRGVVWDEITNLDSILLNESIKHEGSYFKFHDICAQGQLPCYSPLFPIHPTELSRIGYLLAEIPVDDVLLNIRNLNLINHTKTEQMLLQFSHNFIFSSISGLKYRHFLNFTLTQVLGKCKFDNDGILTSSEAISLVYWLRGDNERNIEIARKWQRRVFEIVNRYNSSEIEISFFSTRTPSDETEIANAKMKPLITISGFLMVIFATVCAITKDAVRSKVIISLVGIFSVFLATGSAFGLLIYFKVSFIGINLAAVFLMLGIGIDDMFVILAAWRKTSIHDSVEDRMRETYAHAGVSVTITSVTNVVAFSVGMLTSIEGIRIFSIYTSFSALVTYIFFITFFGGSLAAFGSLEKHQKHSIFCVKVKAKSESKTMNYLYRIFMAGGINSADPNNPLDNEPHYGMLWIRNNLGAILNNSIGKVSICIVYVVYMSVAIYGVKHLDQEKYPDRVSFQQITINFFENYDKFFSTKPSFVQIVFTKELDYTNPNIRKKIMDLHRGLESLDFVDSKFTTSWIRDWYETALQDLDTALRSDTNFGTQLAQRKSIQETSVKNCYETFAAINNLTFKELLSKEGAKKIYFLLQHFACDGQQFLLNFVSEDYIKKNSETVKVLNALFWINSFISKANSIFEMDVNLDQIRNRIQSSRILIAVWNASDIGVQRTLRETVESSGVPGAMMFNYNANIIEQVNIVKWTTVTSVLSTTVVVLFISLIFIPNIFCSLWVVFSIISIELGIVGYMVLWNVKLSSVSMINLIMCIGFSVDFSAHMSYAYVNAPGSNSKMWTKEAIYSVGLPIILGGLSTIIAVLPGFYMDNAIFTTFYKIIMLAIIFGILHAIVFLPTFMALIGPKNFGQYEPHDRLGFVHSIPNNSVTAADMNAVNNISLYTNISDSRGFHNSSLEEKCHISEESEFDKINELLQKPNQSKKLCNLCRSSLHERNIEALSVSKNESTFAENFAITSISGTIANENNRSLATLDVKALQESYC